MAAAIWSLVIFDMSLVGHYQYPQSRGIMLCTNRRRN